MTFSTENPFDGSVPSTVFLPNTPLSGVLVQVKFPEIFSIAKSEFVADFQEQIRVDYPFHRLDENPVLKLTNNEVKQGSIPHWRFLDQTMQWRLSLTTSFLALETRSYQSRSEFIERAYTVVRTLSETVKPNLTVRIGVRYVNQIHGEQLQLLSRYVRPEILGLYAADNQKYLDRAFNEVVCKTDVGAMTSRWGHMPASHTHEPELMPPISASSWFLDFDSYIDFEEPAVFDADEIKTCITNLATRAYGYFRWAVNDDFLRACGGEV